MPVVFTSTLGQDQSGRTGLTVARFGQVIHGISQTPQVWLDHQVFEENGVLVFNWDAVEELFPEGLLDEMFGAYCDLLKRLTEESAWRDLELHLASQKRLALTKRVNATSAPMPEGLLQAPLFRNAATTPDAMAVISDRRSLTYGELSDETKRLAHHLQAAGVRPNTLVAVVMEKGWEQVVAVLGILTAGAAYLPIDAELPSERILYLLDNGQVSIAVTQPSLATTIAWPEAVQRILVESGSIAGYPETLPNQVQEPDDLAYVIYTSGSTGQPKGVMIDHRGALNTVVDINSRFEVTPNDRILALSSLSFDLSVYDIFGALAAGGTIVIPAASSNRDPAAWLSLIRRHQITVWNSVPALMQMLVDYCLGVGVSLPDTLRLIMLSGDWIPVTLPERIRSLIDQTQIVSLGGATEASIWSILFPIERVEPNWRRIPYGAPMRNQTWQVLDADMRPRPVWVAGSLYIGGIGLAKGYWRDQDKTNASFVTCPKTGERLYRTGDVGRYLPDGNIEFLGRDDFEVKIQGYRIELEEIETVLASHVSVQAVAVGVVGELTGPRHLIAYIVPEHNQGALMGQNGAASGAHDANAVDTLSKSTHTGVILDPTERLSFRLAQRALRNGASASYVHLALPSANAPNNEYLRRRSFRTFPSRLVEFDDFSRLLAHLRSVLFEGYPFPKYRYASAGGLYPVQTYVYIRPDAVEATASGTYYYHAQRHELIGIDSSARISNAAFDLVNRNILDRAAFCLFLVADLRAITPLYGDLAPDFCRIEAGIITQLLESAAPDCSIGFCQVGNFAFQHVAQLFRLESEDHLYLHCLVGGGIQIQQMSVAGLIEDAGDLIGKVAGLRAEGDVRGATVMPSLSAEAPPGLQNKLREFAGSKLPKYMIPSSFVILDRLPLTANGKVDRKTLAGMSACYKDSNATPTEPRTPTEKRITAIWQEVLSATLIGTGTDFFATGGDSLSAVRLLTRIQSEYNIEIPIQNLFELTTVAQQAAFVDAITGGRRASKEVGIREQMLTSSVVEGEL
jgi:epothilone synthetase B